VPSFSADADLELGLRWYRERDALYPTLRFDMVGHNVDDWLQPSEPLELDLARLRALESREPEYGAALTEMVVRDADLGPFYRKVRAVIESKELTLHLRIHINAPAQFHAVRWESLRDPETGDRIATQSNVLLSRYLSSPDWRPIPMPIKHDLRALVVVAGPTDVEGYAPNRRALAPVRVNDELDRARAALSDFREVRELAKGTATLSKILQTLEDGFDVLYLVCHGAVNGDVPVLFLEAHDRTADIVDGRKLVERLTALERRPTVVMLCSCQSATRGDELWSADNGELSTLGPRLAGAGVPAVVGMQGDFSMETAATFAPAFFTALAEDGIVDRAMSVARRKVQGRDDWWVPVLFSRLRSGRTYYRPRFTERGDTTWETLRLQLRNDKLTPVLGPGLADAILGSRQDIARSFVERWQMPMAAHSQGELAQVAQYLRVRSAPGTVRTQLFEHLGIEIARRRETAVDDTDPFWELPLDQLRQPAAAIVELGRRLREADPGDPYRVMAALPVSTYVTTAWTDLLQEALRNAKSPREPTTMAFPWNGPADPDALADFQEPTEERPLVYHLFGRFDKPLSLVRRRDIPPAVPPALLEKSLLFLGFRLDDWDFRVIFHAIRSFGGSALFDQNLHIGVQLSPENQTIEPEAAQEYLESYFGTDRVSIYWGEPRHFLDELREQTGLET
jgi:CHAT domain/SIR2-like domain